MARTKATARKSTKKRLPSRTVKSTPLPVEVCERIIDFVALSWSSEQLRLRTLQACALTCHAWLPRSLFHIVCDFDSIRNRNDLSSYVTMLSKYPNFTHFVTNLSISPDWTGGSASWLNVVPQQLVKHLKHVRRIAITSHSNDGIHVFHPHFFHALTLFVSVTELNYSFASQHSFKDFVRFFSSLPNLRQLRVGGEVNWPLEHPSRFAHFTHVKTGLGHLILAHGMHPSIAADIATWLLATPSVTSLTTLEFWGGYGGEVGTAGAKFITACCNLRALTLCLNSRDLVSVDLKNTQHLQSLDIMIDGYRNDFCASLICLLSDISSCDFRHLSVRFNLLDDPDSVLLHDMKQIDSILTSSRFPSLVQFMIDLPIDPTVAFPGLRARNVMVFIVESEDTAVLFKRRYPRS